MPSKIGEGIHRVVFLTVLSCHCVVRYSIRPGIGDTVLCFRHNASAKIMEISRVEALAVSTEP